MTAEGLRVIVRLPDGDDPASLGSSMSESDFFFCIECAENLFGSVAEIHDRGFHFKCLVGNDWFVKMRRVSTVSLFR